MGENWQRATGKKGERTPVTPVPQYISLIFLILVLSAYDLSSSPPSKSMEQSTIPTPSPPPPSPHPPPYPVSVGFSLAWLLVFTKLSVLLVSCIVSLFYTLLGAYKTNQLHVCD